MLALVHLLLSPVISISLVNNRNTIALPRYRNRDRMPKQFLQLDAQRAIYVGLIHLLYRHSWNIRPISLLGVMSNQPDILNGETPEWKLVSGQMQITPGDGNYGPCFSHFRFSGESAIARRQETI